MHEKIKNRIIKNNHLKKLYIYIFFLISINLPQVKRMRKLNSIFSPTHLIEYHNTDS